MRGLRTSLERAAVSGATPEELAERAALYERELWLRHGVVVVRLRETGALPRLVTMALEAWARARFGSAP